MKLRIALGLAAALFIQSHTLAQNPPPIGPISMEFGRPSSNPAAPVTWEAPSNDPNLVVDATHGQFRITADPGVWVTLLGSVHFIPDNQGAGRIVNAFPSLAAQTPVTPTEPSALNWQGVGTTVIPLPTISEFYGRSLYNPDPGTTWQQQQAELTDLFVPILTTHVTSGTQGTRMWEANPEAWVQDLAGTQYGPMYSNLWKQLLYESGDPNTFVMESIAQLCLVNQLGQQAANILINSAEYYNALLNGKVILTLQPFSVFSAGSIGNPGTADSNAATLGSQFPPWPGPVPNPFRFRVILLTATATSGPPNGTPGAWIEVTAFGTVPGTQLRFTGTNQTRPLVWSGDYFHPTRYRARIPQNAQSGPVNVFGPTTGGIDLLFLPYLQIDPILIP